MAPSPGLDIVRPNDIRIDEIRVGEPDDAPLLSRLEQPDHPVAGKRHVARGRPVAIVDGDAAHRVAQRRDDEPAANIGTHLKHRIGFRYDLRPRRRPRTIELDRDDPSERSTLRRQEEECSLVVAEKLERRVELGN